jgi:hypothetical protein
MRDVEAQKAPPAKARAQARLERARAEASAKIAAALEAAKREQAIDFARKTAVDVARDARLRAWPLSILVSRASQRIYVRHGFEQELELPAVIKEPERSIGTHAFYAVENPASERGWLATSLFTGKERTSSMDALDRVELPDAITRLLGKGAWSGSTLIISDEPPYKETGPGTDFIVVLSNEPQGALKIRSPDDARPVAAASRPAPQRRRSYRTASDDGQFRHPLGGF